MSVEDRGDRLELPLAAVTSLRVAAARDGWLAAAVTQGTDGETVRATVNR